ncbi:MAG: Uma2 family endonuclease [Gemmatimonadales bacterium]
MAMPLANYYSADDVRALPDDGNRYETVYGELLVTPAPGGRHQLILGRLFHILDNYLRNNGLEQLLWSPADISWSSDTLVQPDIFVAELDAWKRSLKWADIQVLHLAVEALSPSTAHQDRFTKRHLYQEHVPVYWIVDDDRRQVEIWTSHSTVPTVERLALVWRHPALDNDCIVDLGWLFAD